MATVMINQFGKRQFGGVSPFGNLTELTFKLTTNSSGGAEDANSSVALASGDKVVLGSLPAGMRLSDAQIIISTTFSASVTGSLGFEYADGVDDSVVPQDAAYFGSDLALSTAARLRVSTAKAPVILAKDANLVLTTGGADNAKAARLDVIVSGELNGPA